MAGVVVVREPDAPRRRGDAQFRIVVENPTIVAVPRTSLSARRPTYLPCATGACSARSARHSRPCAICGSFTTACNTTTCTARRSGRGRTIPARRPRPGDPVGEGDQSRPRPTWTRLERSLPCSRAPDAARSTECAGLRPEQRSQASSCDARARSVLVCPVVRRMECRAGPFGRHGADRCAPDVARARRLATARSHPRR